MKRKSKKWIASKLAELQETAAGGPSTWERLRVLCADRLAVWRGEQLI